MEIFLWTPQLVATAEATLASVEAGRQKLRKVEVLRSKSHMTKASVN
jgi:hypothetical protein